MLTGPHGSAAVVVAAVLTTVAPVPASATAPEPIFTLPLPPLTLGARRVTVRVDVSTARRELLRVARSTSSALLLDIRDVSAARQPAVVWRVYLRGSPSSSHSAEQVGAIALYGSGIRADSRRPFRPARFSFPADDAVGAALSGGSRTVILTFAPIGPLINGKPSQPKPAASVRVGTISFSRAAR